MNRILLITLVIIFLSSCVESTGKYIQKATVEQFCNEIISDKTIQLIDVRTPEEFEEGHIENATLIDIQNEEEFLSNTKELNKKQPVYVYCRTGRRSNIAAKHLANNGFRNIVDLQGGIIVWNAQNHNCK